MRATRAYLASLGTTGLLVLSSVLLLVLGSAVVSFNGWPGGSGGGQPETVVVTAASAPRSGGGPEEVATLAAPAAEAVAEAAPAPAAEAPAAELAPDTDGGRDDFSPPTGERPAPPAAPAPGPAPPPETPTDDGDPGDPAPVLPGVDDLLPSDRATLTDNLADGLESTTTYLGQEVVGQLSPPLGNLVTQVGQGLTDLVRALDGTAPAPRQPRGG